MTYKQFKEKIEQILKEKNCTEQFEPYIYYGGNFKDCCAVYWITGGVKGGSCWESSNPQPYTTNDPEKELTSFDYILEYFKKDILYFEYKLLERKTAIIEHHADREYYGNRTDYSIKKLNLIDLYNYLKEKGWLK